MDYFTVGGAAVTSWMSKSALAPCQEPKKTQVERSHPPSHPSRRGGSALNLIHTHVSGEQPRRGNEIPHSPLQLSCPAFLTPMDNKRTRVGLRLLLPQCPRSPQGAELQDLCTFLPTQVLESCSQARAFRTTKH